MAFKDKNDFLYFVQTKCKNTRIVYNKNNIVILKVESFEDCNALFCKDSINWCIAKNHSHWNDYVNKPLREQYFIIDFNTVNSKNNYNSYNNSLIGFTLKEGKLYAAHARNDDNLLDSREKEQTGYHPFERILKDKKIYNFVVKNGMNGDQVDDFDEVATNGIWVVIAIISIILFAMTSLFINKL